mmetsp:Transcript_16245/g.33397  ORF Transcript_16245/g.33397 Transcript_16245/m.33397 type:complete len:212 (+) Transcript_16245:403-1038(+)
MKKNFFQGFHWSPFADEGRKFRPRGLRTAARLPVPWKIRENDPRVDTPSDKALITTKDFLICPHGFTSEFSATSTVVVKHQNVNDIIFQSWRSNSPARCSTFRHLPSHAIFFEPLLPCPFLQVLNNICFHCNLLPLFLPFPLVNVRAAGSEAKRSCGFISVFVIWGYCHVKRNTTVLGKNTMERAGEGTVPYWYMLARGNCRVYYSNQSEK